MRWERLAVGLAVTAHHVSDEDVDSARRGAIGTRSGHIEVEDVVGGNRG